RQPHPLEPGAPAREGSPRPGTGGRTVHNPAPPPAATLAPRPDPLAALVASGWAGAVYWRPLPGEDRGARITALVEAVLGRGGGGVGVPPGGAGGVGVGDAVRKAFPDAADLASDLSDRRRYRAWAELRRGRRVVVVGGRSS